MFVEVSKRYALNIDQIAYIDRGEKSWTVHFADGQTLTLDHDAVITLDEHLARVSRAESPH